MFRFIVTSIFAFSLSFNLTAKPLDPFEMRNTPIADFVQWVSQETGNNIILGRGVEGPISLHVKSLDSNDVMHLFEKVLTSNGYALRTSNGIYQVILDSSSTFIDEPLITKVYKLNNLRSSKASGAITSILTSNITTPDSEQATATMVSKHSVTVLPSSNAILVTGNKNQISMVDEFIAVVDSDIPQVLIEAVIMESDLLDSEEIGVNLSSALSNNGFSFIQNSMSSASDIQMLGLGGHAVLSRGGNIRGLITALISNSNTKILSTPQILVMDRERGHISVGQNVPFIISNEVTDGGNAIQKIERRDVGVSLSVVPHVLASGEIVLQISQESSSVASSTQASDLITNKRSISTVARVVDGQTLLLGGLVTDEERKVQSGVPVLKDVPLLGALFRSERSEKSQKELTMMIRTTLL
ncbi:hypothetical protein [Marinomonas gallaica]|uniref:hypothetical protein n=1 Tax=Marinomonas gallaica TaxID=1806667 RepID=UPI00082E9874|nr:hypothetical protein [Marinomonas gallaica]